MDVEGQKFADLIAQQETVLFVNGHTQSDRTSYNREAVEIVTYFAPDAQIVDLLQDNMLRDEVFRHSNWHTTPQLFVRGRFVGGLFVIPMFFASGEYHRWTARQPSREVLQAAVPYLRPSSSPWKSTRQRDGAVFTANADGCVRRYEAASCAPPSRYPVCTMWTNAICILGGDIIAAGAADGMLYFADCSLPNPRFEPVWSAGSWINDLAYDELRDRLYAVDNLGTLCRLDTSLTSITAATLARGRAPAWSVACDPQTATVAMGLGTGEIILVNSQNDLDEGSLLFSHDGAVTEIVYDGEAFCAVGFDGWLRRFAPNGRQLGAVRVHTARAWDVDFDDGHYFSVGADRHLTVIDRERMTVVDRQSFESMPLNVSCGSGAKIIFFANGSVVPIGTTNG